MRSPHTTTRVASTHCNQRKPMQKQGRPSAARNEHELIDSCDKYSKCKLQNLDGKYIGIDCHSSNFSVCLKVFLFFFLNSLLSFVFYEFIYLFLALTGAGFSLVVGGGCSLVAVCELRLVEAFLVVCRAWPLERGLSSCGGWTWLLRRIGDLPRPGIEPVSPALAGRFFTAEPQGNL